MKRNNLLLSLFALVILLSSFSNVTAQNYGLEWGVAEGQRFDYSISGTLYEDGEIIRTIQEYCYVIVDNLDNIEAPGLLAWSYHYVGYWANGSEFTYPMWPRINFVVFPVGNWTYVAEQVIGGVSIPEISFEEIDTDTLWGYNSTVTLSTIETVETLEVSKTDGATYHFKYIERNFTTSQILAEYEVLRILHSLDLLLLVGSAGGIVVILVMGGVMLKKRGSI